MHPYVIGGLFTILVVDAYFGGRIEIMLAFIWLGAFQFYDMWKKQKAIDAEILRKHHGDE